MTTQPLMLLFSVVALAAGCAAPALGGGGAKSATYSTPYGTTTPGTTTTPTTGTPTDADGDGVESPADCDDRDPSSAPGVAELACDGRDNDCGGDGDERTSCDFTTDSADLVIPLPVDLAPGVSWDDLRVQRDASGDGLPDLWADVSTGGPLSRTIAWSLAGRVVAEPFVQADGGHVMFPGDVDGDGADDLWAGDFYPTPVSGSINASEKSSYNDGDDAALSGDWDSDGVTETLIYAYGSLAWFASTPPADAGSEDADSHQYTGADPGDGTLPQIQHTDIDGDGNLEFVVGGFAANYTWAYWANFLTVVEGTPGPGDWITDLRDVGFGNVMALGDLNADGQVDVVSGGPALQIVYGPITGDGWDRFHYPDVSTGDADQNGALEIVPDFDGDGRNEVLFTCSDRVVLADFGTPGYLPDPCVAGYTFAVEITDVSPVNHFFAAGDLDGDGLADVAVLDLSANVVRVWFGHAW